MELTKEEIIEKLKLEKSILADGGYGRSVRTPWRSPEYFRDSISCLNVGESEKVHPCTECFLINYMHPAQRNKDLPCHMIPLNAEGETIYSLLRIGDVEKLEQLLLEWLDKTIEQESKTSCALRAPTAALSQSGSPGFEDGHPQEGSWNRKRDKKMQVE